MMKKILAVVIVAAAITLADLHGKWAPNQGQINGSSINDIIPHHQKPGVWYVVLYNDNDSESSVFVTRDGGKSYEPVHFPSNLQEYSSIAVLKGSFACPEADGDNLYALAWGTNSAGGDWLILRSSDAGKTWFFRNAVNIGDSTEDDPVDLIASPDGSKIFCIEGRNERCSSDSYHTLVSIDDGQTFLYPAGSGNSSTPMELIFSMDPNIVYMNNGLLFKSVDGGLTWERTGNFGIISADVAPDSPEILYALYSEDYKPSRLNISTDGGKTWQDRHQNLWEYSSNYNKCSIVSPDSNPGTIYIYSNSLSQAAGIIRTQDNGGSWYPMTNGIPAGYGYQKLVPDPFNPGRPWLFCGKYLYHWVPENQAPMISLAGWDPAAIRKTSGGTSTLWARVIDPDGPMDIRQVDLIYAGLPTGIQLYDDGEHDDLEPQDGFWGITFDLKPDTVPEGMYLFEISATDFAGNQSSIWPYLNIGTMWQWDQERTEAENDWVRLRRHESGDSPAGFISGGYPWDNYSRENSPDIVLAGWTFTPQNTCGSLIVNFAALVLDPQGSNNLNSVEFFADGYPKGVSLLTPARNTSYNIGYCGLPGFYGLNLTIGHPIPPGNYLLELSASDIDGFRSALWPYLTVY